MKNLAIVIIALIGTSLISVAQDGTTQTEPAKIEVKNRPLNTTPTPVQQDAKKTQKKKTVPAKKETAVKK